MPALKRERNRRYREKHGDALRAKARAKYEANPAHDRERHLVRKYGVDLGAYERLFAAQDGKCAICRRSQERAFDVDHCHSTGAVRGLLCTNCNRMVGHAHDDPGRLDAAAAYLRAFPQVAAEVIGAYMDCRP